MGRKIPYPDRLPPNLYQKRDPVPANWGQCEICELHTDVAIVPYAKADLVLCLKCCRDLWIPVLFVKPPRGESAILRRLHNGQGYGPERKTKNTVL